MLITNNMLTKISRNLAVVYALKKFHAPKTKTLPGKLVGQN